MSTPYNEESTMSATDKTKSLLRLDISVDKLTPNELNPNEMSEESFNLLYDNIGAVGVTDPILVRPNGEGKYKIVGGHHRWEVAKLHGMTTVPCTVITDPSFDDDMEKFQVVRHNVIRGELSPKKFLALYESLSTKYANDVAAEMFGFSDKEEFAKLIKATANTLPEGIKQKFTEAAKELKTIDGLATLLNRLFTDYGDTLPHGFMVFDFGGHDNVWLRMSKSQKPDFLAFAEVCRDNGYSVDSAVALILHLIATNKIQGVTEHLSALPKTGKMFEVQPPAQQ